MKLRIGNMIPVIIKIDVLFGLVILAFAFMGKSRDLNPQWYTINFMVFIGGLYIYTKTKNKIFYSVFLYAFIYSSMVLIDLMIPEGIISEGNRVGNTLLSAGFIVLGIGGFFVALYLNRRNK